MSKNHKLITNVGFISLGIGLTPVSESVLPSLGNIIEPFLLLGIYLINRFGEYKIPIKACFTRKQNAWCILFLFLLVISMFGLFVPFYEKPDLYKNIYADYRALYIFVFTFMLFTSPEWSHRDKINFLKKFLWIIIAFGFYCSYNRIQYNLEGWGNNDRTLSIPIHFLLLQTILYYKNPNPLFNIILLIISGYYALFSFARINIFIFILQYLVFIMSIFSFSRQGIVRKLFKISIILISVYISVVYAPKVYELYTISSAGQAQVDKLQNLSSETERISSLTAPFTDSESYLVPHGLGWRNHINNISLHYKNKILSTQDSCWLYLFYHFGLLFGILISYYLFRYLYNNVTSCKVSSIISIIKILVLIGFLGCFFSQGIFFTVPQFAFAGGFNDGVYKLQVPYYMNI